MIGKHAATAPDLALEQAQRGPSTGQDRCRVGQLLWLRHFANLLHDEFVRRDFLVLEIERVNFAIDGVARVARRDFLEQFVQRFVVALPCHHMILPDLQQARALVECQSVIGAARRLVVIHKHLLRHGGRVGVGHARRADLCRERRPHIERAGRVGVVVVHRHAVSQLDLIREGVMHEDRHTGITLVHAESLPLEVGVVVVKTGVHAPDRPENTALLLLCVVAGARAGGVVVEVIQQTAAVAVVQPRAREVPAVLHVARTAETNFLRAIKRRQRGNECLPLALDELAGADQFSNPLQPVGQVGGQPGLVRLGQARVDLPAQCLAVGQALGHELVPQIERDCDGRVGRVFGDQFSQQTELGRLAADEFCVAWLDRFHRQRVGAGLGFGHELELGRCLELGHSVAEILRQLRLERHQRRRGAGAVDAPARRRANHHLAPGEREQLAASCLVAFVVKRHAKIFRQNRDVRVGRRGIQHNDSGDARHLRRHVVGQQNVGARQLAGAECCGDFVAFDKHQPAHRPAVGIDRVRAGFPALRRDKRHVVLGESFRHRAAGVRLLEGRHVQPAQRLRLVERGIDQSPKKANHRRGEFVLSDELDGVLTVFLGEQNRAHHRTTADVIERRAVELHVRHVVELRHVFRAEVVVKFLPIAVLKIDRRQVIHQHGELYPLRFLGHLRTGRHPRAAIGRLELDEEFVAWQAESSFPVGRRAELGRRGLEQLKKSLSATHRLAETKRYLRRGRHRKPVGQVAGKHQRTDLPLANTAGLNGRLAGRLAKPDAQLRCRRHAGEYHHAKRSGNRTVMFTNNH